MLTATAPHVTQAQALPGSNTVALTPAARRSLGRLEEYTGLSRADLANCAITWYAFFDAQLRAGHHLTLWNAETGKAYTLSLTAGFPSAASDVRWPPDGEARGAGSGARAAPGFYFKPGRPSPAQAPHVRYRRLPGCAAAPARPWLTIATSRGSPAAPADGGGGRTMCRPVTGPPAWQRAPLSRNGGSS